MELMARFYKERMFTTLFADTRLMPIPPALVDKRKISFEGVELKLSINPCRCFELTPPSWNVTNILYYNKIQ